MKYILMIVIVCLTVFTAEAQKEKKEKKAKKEKTTTRIPSIDRSYTRFSVFAYQDNQYVHQETNDVWMDTFLELNAKTRKVLLPGLGAKQFCSYEEDESEFFETEGEMELIVLKIECSGPGGTEENRVLRIHTVRNAGKKEYIFSLGYTDAKDLVLFHDYTDQQIGQFLSKDLIRFE